MYEDLSSAYQIDNVPSLQIGGILLNNQLIADGPVHLVLKSFNRHGLIAGATGTGKTKTIQALTEQLSLAGVPCLVMDIKGDLSGLAMPGAANNDLTARNQSLKVSYSPRGFPVEFLSLSETNPGLPLRSTIQDFGPLLFSRMLDLNETQEGVITVLFQYAKEEKLPLIDLEDFKSLLQFAQTTGNSTIENRFGGVSTASLGTIMRKIIELETQGGDGFFGEPAFDIMDLIKVNSEGLGVISVLRLLDMQEKPKLFSTFMLKLLSDAYRKLPELGDPEKPTLIIFIDEAHLIFKNASKALLSLLDTIVKLIRSKGIGLIFCTQTPNDIPENILSQLGLKIQHALRAFTAKDRKAMKLVAQNFPPSDYYKTEELLTSLSTGEALLSSLDYKGQPTPLIQCLIRAPESRMGILTDGELKQKVSASTLSAKYNTRRQTHSTKDILASQNKDMPQKDQSVRSEKDTSGLVTAVTKNVLFRQVIRQIFRQLMNAILVAVGMKKK